MEKKTAYALFAVLVVGLLIGLPAGYYLHTPSAAGKDSVSVISAGSLKYALQDSFSNSFANATGIETGYTFIGSVAGARLIQSGEQADVFVSASASVIPSMLMVNDTNWMMIFATNQMAITWLNEKYSISPGSFWFENLTAKDVTVSASNASLDPSGYVAIEMTKLAGILYTQWNNSLVKAAFNYNYSKFETYNNAWNSWFGPNGTLVQEDIGPGYPVNDPLALYDQIFVYMLNHNKMKLTTEEIGLNAYLQSGAADYALTYRSQAKSQGLYYFENATGDNGLPSWINLGSLSENQVAFYQFVNASGPAADNIGNITASPIMYALTVLNASKNAGAADQYVYYLVTSMGEDSLTANYFSPLSTPYGMNIQNMPAELQSLVKPIPAYIPYSDYA